MSSHGRSYVVALQLITHPPKTRKFECLQQRTVGQQSVFARNDLSRRTSK